MNRLISFVNKIFYLIISMSIFLILVFICLQIFFRFVLNNALPWPEEASRFLMLLSLFLAAVYAFRDGEHVGLDFFLGKFSKNTILVIRIISNVLILGFLLVVVYGGFQEAYTLMPLKTGALRISRGIPYLIIPISSILFIIVCFRLIFEDIMEMIRGKKYK